MNMSGHKSVHQPTGMLCFLLNFVAIYVEYTVGYEQIIKSGFGVFSNRFLRLLPRKVINQTLNTYVFAIPDLGFKKFVILRNLN